MRMFVPGGADIPVSTTIAPTTVAPTTALVCSTCPQATIITGSGVGIDQPITQTLGTNANGCRTVTITCTSPTAGQTVNFFVCFILHLMYNFFKEFSQKYYCFLNKFYFFNFLNDLQKCVSLKKINFKKCTLSPIINIF
jgi:hypothetical protein